MKRKAMKKSHKKTFIAAFLLFIFGAIIAVGVYQNRFSPPPQPKVRASDYFEIPWATVDDATPTRNASGAIVAWELYTLRYNLTAVKGDAHNVIVKSWALAPPETFDVINKGENVTVVQTSQSAPYLLNEKNADGKFKFTVDIISKEAEGKIVIWL